jgi:glycerol-3-phosphate dehydrogenase
MTAPPRVTAPRGGPYDLLVIGGGINGAGIARDAAGRGLSVLLCEKGDLASGTSSASSKLIHGGLRYLEYGEFRLVRESLMEREVLLAAAPHIIWPLRFVLPHDASLRPRPLIRLGLFLYDHLGGRRTLPGTEAVKLRRDPRGAPLQARITDGFVYSDCWVQDARLVVLNARDAAARGSTILTRTEVKSARREGELWRATIRAEGGSTREVAARILVNAAGPWVLDVVESAAVQTRAAIRLVKGSHIVVPKLYDGEQAYILQNDDRRIVFVIPYEGAFTLIGTTDVPFEGDPAGVAITPDEIRYLCRAVSRWFARPPQPEDVVWSYSGVRPLYDDQSSSVSAVTRDYVFDLDSSGGAPALTVFGGKITTYRRLAEHALEKLAPFLPRAGAKWTARAKLPGGDLPGGDPAAFAAELRREFPFLDPGLALRLTRSYGSEARRMLDGAKTIEGLGRQFGAGLSEREVDWLVREEWARTPEDILWRRSKLGLRLRPDEAGALAGWLGARIAA